MKTKSEVSTETKQMTLTVYFNNKEVIEVTFLIAGSGFATIDWGDGTPQKKYNLTTADENCEQWELDCDVYIFQHKYYTDNETFVTITITGENITHLDCNGLERWKKSKIKLDVTKNPTLKWLDCSFNNLTSLDLSKNVALNYLNCSCNKLSSLDVSKNVALTILDCCENFEITNLDISKNISLTYLKCRHNSLTILDVSANTMLMDLNCSCNHLSALDLNKNTALRSLECVGGIFPSLDLSKNVQLTYLHCCYCEMMNLDLSENKLLSSLDCGHNKLSHLDVSKNTLLTDLDCYDNEFSAEALNNLFDTLPIVKKGEIQIGKNLGKGVCNKDIAKKKGWKVKTVWEDPADFF